MRDFEIICIGEPLVEFNQINGTQWHQGFGGDVSNVAIGAARLGARSAIATRLGDDGFGQELRNLWSREGVDASCVATDASAPTGLGFPLHERPDVRGADARLQASLSDASGARWSRLPRLDLSVNAGLQFFKATELSTQSNWSSSLTFSVPLFDGFDRNGRIREAVAGVEAAEASLRQVEVQAVSEVRSAAAQQEEQVRQLEAFQEQFDASRLAYDESRRRYLVGIATFLDVLNASNGMQQAELNVVRTKRNVLGSWIQLRQASGGGWTRGLGRE